MVTVAYGWGISAAKSNIRALIRPYYLFGLHLLRHPPK